MRRQVLLFCTQDQNQERKKKKTDLDVQSEQVAYVGLFCIHLS